MSCNHAPYSDRVCPQCVAALAADQVVGHKTFVSDEGEISHQPLTASEALALCAAADEARRKRAKAMPDQQAALSLLFEAWLRLKELGWQDAICSPKDGSTFQAIEVGSTGIHACFYMGEWPKGGWWVADRGDLFPAHPSLWRPLPEDA
jgi:hypothetical protein